MKISKQSINQAHRLERISRKIYHRLDHQRLAIEARRSCRQQLKSMNGGFKGTNQQFQKDVLTFWNSYNIKPHKMWFDLYGFKDQRYNPYYIPEDIYWTTIYPKVNKVEFRQAYTDKCFYDRLFPTLKQPRFILKNSHGILYDQQHNIITYDMALNLLSKETTFVIKPSIHSGEGIDITFYKQRQYSIDNLLQSYQSNYIIQEIADQHEILKSLHPESLNTIRIISYLYQGEVHISSAILRIGQGGSKLDNFTSGGVAVAINDDGSLHTKGVNVLGQWLTHHPDTNIEFESITLPNYNKVIEAVKQAHLLTHHFMIIGWDFTIDKDGEPLFIEYNGAPGMNQITGGPLFGKHTKEILNSLLIKGGI
ncbi:MAG: hexapeptide transferase [Erysipelothrix sp.]|nr:hexapeptide transferase [Erysipelothrix sp.]